MPRGVPVLASEPEAAEPVQTGQLDVLDAVQKRVLWLATSMVHHANKVRETDSGVKVGGHQASSASIVSIMTALYFEHLRAPDRVSVKPHAAPVLHAINYLLGRLDESLPAPRCASSAGCRATRAAPRTPTPSTSRPDRSGSAPPRRSGARSPTATSPGTSRSPRAGARSRCVGDAELDEGAIWEALVDPMVARLGEVLWIVDLNRQSLDRVVPDIAAGRVGAMFEAAGWQTITVKYGRRLRELFARRGGEALRARIDRDAQRGVPAAACAPPPPSCASACPAKAARGATSSACSKDLADERARRRRARPRRPRPRRSARRLPPRRRGHAIARRSIFAYTIKAWSLPTEGHPGNHSALLSDAQWRELAGELGADVERPLGAL